VSGRTPIAIEARDVRKSFTIPHERQTTLKERALRPGTWLRGEARRLDTLRGVSFDVARGEFFGVIGRNGCGKSTLLKLLASIYRLDGGTVRVAGRLAPFIELGVGFNNELQARDNVVLNAVMMGLSPGEARARYDRIIDYAELRDFTDLKLKNYSLGMQVRLAFATMLEVDADVLLVDEVLAVGDLAFQEKCIDSLEERKRRGTAVVLVTHDMDSVIEHCDRAMLIEDGVADTISDPRAVTERFVDVILPRTGAGSEVGRGVSPATVPAAWLTDGGGRTVQAVARGEPVTVNATIRAGEATRGLSMMIELLSHPEGVRIASFPVEEGVIPPLAPGEEATARVRLDAGSLEPGDYRFGYELSAGDRRLDRCAEPLRLRVLGEDRGAGAVSVGHSVAVDPGASEASR
jgi:ABC-type polysaccharide/polyol phosphate transport system ATPase subunit